MATCLSTCLPVGGPNRVLQEALVLWSSTYVKTLPKLIWVPMNQVKVMFTWSMNLRYQPRKKNGQYISKFEPTKMWFSGVMSHSP